MNVQTKLLEIVSQLKVFHWQTKSYARHMAFGASYDALSPLVDEFIEVYLGTLDKRLPIEQFELENVSDDSKQFCLDTIETFKQLKEGVSEYPDLTNLCDEMIGVIGKLKYLLTLK